MMEDKTQFYDKTLKTLIFSSILTFGLLFILPENLLDKTSFLIPWYILLAITIISEIIFTIGMIVYSIKIKKYGWTVAILFLGTIFPIIFYLSIMKKEFKKEIKSKSDKES